MALDIFYIILLILVGLTVNILFAYLCRKKARAKNRDVAAWTVLGFLLEVIGFIILSLLETKPKPPTREQILLNRLSSMGYIFGTMYLIYAIVSIVLSILDRTYLDIEANIIFLIYGILFMTVSHGFKSRQKWGWFGYVILLALILILSVVGMDIYILVFGIPAILVLYYLFKPSVRRLYFET